MVKSLIGISLKPDHYDHILSQKPDIGWVEIHSENYINFDNYDFQQLQSIRKDYPVSIHGIGMSLGSAEGIDFAHLKKIKTLIERIDPFIISEHLSWSSVDGIYLPDLMPIPYNEESLKIFTTNLSKAQEYLGREILIENPSSYFEYTDSVYSEPEFLNKVTKKAGAKILLDINNIYVSCKNNEQNYHRYIDEIDHSLVEEIHIAGHSTKQIQDHHLYIDSHDNFVTNEVWNLYRYTIQHCHQVLTLLEWDQKIPPLDILVNEAKKAQRYLDQYANLREYQYA